MKKKYITLFLATLTQLGHSWTGPLQVSGSGSNFQPYGAINSSGEGEVAWISGSYPLLTLYSSTYSMSWSPPSQITQGLLSSVKVGIDSTGNAVAVWQENLLGNYVIRASTKPFNGLWSLPTTISTSSFNDGLVLAVNATGDLYVCWLDLTTNHVIAINKNINNPWPAPVTISSPGQNPQEPQISINSGGDGYAIWTDISDYSIHSAICSNAIWGLDQILSQNGVNQYPDIASGGVSQALALWENRSADEIRSISYNSGWNFIQQIISSSNVGNPSVVATGTDGFAAWFHDNSGEIQVTNLYSGNWSYPVFTVSNSSDNSNPSISIRADDSALITWSDNLDGRVKGVFFPNGGAPGVIELLSSQGQNYDVQCSSSGLSSLVIWQTTTATDALIFANIN